MPEDLQRDPRGRRRARLERLREQGATHRSIAAALGTPERTLFRWFANKHAPLRNRRPSGSILDPHRAYLERRYAEGCHNASQLWRELRGQGFGGRPGIVHLLIGRWKKAGPGGAPAGMPSRSGWTPPSVHTVTRLLASDRDDAPDGDQRLCARLLEEVPGLAAAADAARRLARVLRKESAEALTDVPAAMKETPPSRLAASLERNVAAIQAALDTPWTTSPAEGQINKLKTLKCTAHALFYEGQGRSPRPSMPLRHNPRKARKNHKGDGGSRIGHFTGLASVRSHLSPAASCPHNACPFPTSGVGTYTEAATYCTLSNRHIPGGRRGALLRRLLEGVCRCAPPALTLPAAPR